MVPEARCILYTCEDATSASLSERAFNSFGVRLVQPVEVLRLYNGVWVEASSYPRFTLLGQSLGSMVLAWEALWRLSPSLFLDTSGYAFTYPVAVLYGCQVACYTHYPTISTDMLERVKRREEAFNNDTSIANSDSLSDIKLRYYKTMARLYGLAGWFTSVAMVNSSWTENHIKHLWKHPEKIYRVYPPCDTISLQKLPLEREEEGRERYIISLAQFRPEKAHGIQLQAFSRALKEGGLIMKGVKLKLVGSSRHREDEERIEMLSSLAVDLGIEGKVDVCTNVPYSALQSLLGGAVAGLHSMTDEHFGISVVEYMAAGAVPIAHNSGGPKEDIVVEDEGEQTGLLAKTVEEFSEAIIKVFSMSKDERLKMAMAARRRASQFSEARFDRDFKEAMKTLLLSLR